MSKLPDYHSKAYFGRYYCLIRIVIVIAIRISSFTIFRLVLMCDVDLVCIFSVLALFYMVRHADGAPSSFSG